MKSQNSRPISQTVTIKASVIALGLFCGLMLDSSAQKAESIDPAAKQSLKHGEKETPAPLPVDDKPSRFAGGDMAAYTISRAAVLSMVKRETDPFGLNQDPSVKPAPKNPTTPAPQKRLAALPPTPLGDIVKMIRVTTIMPGEKKFLVGIRTFSEGDEFPLLFQTKRMRMKVTEVSAKRIIFKNMDNGDEASLETGMLPPGMITGKGTMRPAGMVSTTDDLTLDLGTPDVEPPNN